MHHIQVWYDEEKHIVCDLVEAFVEKYLMLKKSVFSLTRFFSEEKDFAPKDRRWICEDPRKLVTVKDTMLTLSVM